LYGNLALQVWFECFGSADVPAVDEHVRRVMLPDTALSTFPRIL
jgi:hypothetical protein